MNKEDFLKEMHDYIDELFSWFEKYQNDVTTSLIEFDKLCRMHDIRYYLGFGSLLGAFRDGDNLPWDYDIDVMVPITEKNRLLEALNTDLCKDYYFYCPETDPNCRHYIMRITKNGYDSSAVHMDVFWLIGAPENKQKRERFRKQVKRVNRIRYAKLCDVDIESMGIKVFKLAGVIKKLFFALYPITILDRKEKKLCSLVPFSSAKYVTTMQAVADTYTSDLFCEPSEINVRDSLISAPTNITKYLEQTYKNYTEYPVISSRFDEFYNTCKRLKYFESKTKPISKMDYQINI